MTSVGSVEAMLKAGLVVLVLATACGGIDPPWAGPSLPSGARQIALTSEGSAFPGFCTAPSVLAATSVVKVRQHADTTCRDRRDCAPPVFTCWSDVPDRPGRLYVAILTGNECNRPVKEETAFGGRTLYFIHWVGHWTRACNAMVAAPSYRLFSIPRSALPGPGTLTAELQIQDEDNGWTTYDTEVDLT